MYQRRLNGIREYAAAGLVALMPNLFGCGLISLMVNAQQDIKIERLEQNQERQIAEIEDLRNRLKLESMGVKTGGVKDLSKAKIYKDEKAVWEGEEYARLAEIDRKEHPDATYGIFRHKETGKFCVANNAKEVDLYKSDSNYIRLDKPDKKEY